MMMTKVSGGNKTHLLLQGHDGVNPEIAALTGVSDSH